MLMPGTPRYFHKRKYTENLNTHCILKFVIIISKNSYLCSLKHV